MVFENLEIIKKCDFKYYEIIIVIYFSYLKIKLYNCQMGRVLNIGKILVVFYIFKNCSILF